MRDAIKGGSAANYNKAKNLKKIVFAQVDFLVL